MCLFLDDKPSGAHALLNLQKAKVTALVKVHQSAVHNQQLDNAADGCFEHM